MMAEHSTRLFIRVHTRWAQHRNLIVEHAQGDAERGSILAELAYGVVAVVGIIGVGALIVSWMTDTANSLPTP